MTKIDSLRRARTGQTGTPSLSRLRPAQFSDPKKRLIFVPGRTERSFFGSDARSVKDSVNFRASARPDDSKVSPEIVSEQNCL